jgi:site-specific DNA recombinase
MAPRLPFMAHDQTSRVAVEDQTPNVFVFRCWPTGASIKLALNDLHNGLLRPELRQAYAIGPDIGERWPELSAARKRAVLTALIDRIEVSVDQIEIRLHPPRLGALLDVTATPLQSMTDDEIQTLSVPVCLRRAGREIRMVIDGTDPFAAAQPDMRLIKLLLRARQFNATLAHSEGVPFAALAEREGVSRSYFTRLVRLSYLAPDITQAILDGRQPRDLTAEKLLEHSRLPLAWHDQRTVLGFA